MAPDLHWNSSDPPPTSQFTHRRLTSEEFQARRHWGAIMMLLSGGAAWAGKGKGGSRREGWEPVGQSARLTPCVPTTLGPPSPSNPPTFFFFTPRTQREKGAALGKVSSAVIFDFNFHPASITWHQRSRVTGGAAVCCVNTRALPHPEFSMQRIFPNSWPTAGSYTRGGKLRIPTTRVPTCYIITR